MKKASSSSIVFLICHDAGLLVPDIFLMKNNTTSSSTIIPPDRIATTTYWQESYGHNFVIGGGIRNNNHCLSLIEQVCGCRPETVSEVATASLQCFARLGKSFHLWQRHPIWKQGLEAGGIMVRTIVTKGTSARRGYKMHARRRWRI